MSKVAALSKNPCRASTFTGFSALLAPHHSLPVRVKPDRALKDTSIKFLLVVRNFEWLPRWRNCIRKLYPERDTGKA